MKKTNESFKFGIRQKLFFLVLVGFSLLIVVTSWRIGVEANRAANTTIDRTLMQSSQIMRTKILSRFDSIADTAKSLAKDGRVLPLVYDSESATLQDLSLEFKKALAFDILFFTDSAGVVLARSDRPEAIGQSLSGKGSLFDTALTGKLAQGIIVSQDKLLQIVVVPVFDNFATDVVRGTIALAYELSPEIAKEIHELTASDIGFFAFVRDANGTIASTKSSFNTHQKLTSRLEEYFKANEASWRNIYETKELEVHFDMKLADEDFFAIAKPLANHKGENLGFILALTSRTELLMPFTKIQQQVYLIGFICLLVASLIAWVIATRISLPIIALVTIAKKIQEGSFPEKAERKDINDEVGLLHNAVITMGNTLKEKAELESYLAQLSADIDMSTVDLPLNLEDEVDPTVSRNQQGDRKPASGDATEYSETDYIQDTQVPSKAPEVKASFLHAGMVVNERYDVVRHLGAGAMADVYLAKDRDLGEFIALKILHQNTFATDELEQFKEEIRLARRITHRNILRTYDFGVWEKRYFITMEYVQGFDMAHMLEKTGAMNIGTGLAMARQICSAIKAAHDQGIIHRDLKPSNMMINKQGIIKIMDFGLAMNIAGIKGNQRQTMIAGTPKYMAPEQFLGGHLDERTDIYALGILLYAVFNGKPPFSDAKTFEELEKLHLYEVPPQLSSRVKAIPTYLNDVISKAIEKRTTDRYQSVSELLEDLNAI
jgi:eukaryotic-like serine/threonine-protein kinase